MKTPEGFEKAEIKKYLVSIGAWYFCPYMAGFGKAGVPDIVACAKGKMIGIEVKRFGVKKLTPLQHTCLQRIWEAGGFVTWGDAERVIAELKLFVGSDRIPLAPLKELS